MHRHTVPEGVAATPLGKYLTRAFPRLPAWLIRETLKKKDVRINGAKSGADASVKSGDELTMYIDEKYFAAPLDILFEDDRLLVVDKPAGIPVDSDRANIGADTMLARIQAHCPSAQLCHRLDTGTGGVLIAAKTPESLNKMLTVFREHKLTKKYRCIVVGKPAAPQAKLTAYLIKDAASARVSIVQSPRNGALPIETHYKLLESKNGLSLLEVTLITGRTHQIRAHLSSISLPLLGDDKYGDRAANRRYKCAQPQLWCSRIDVEGHTFISSFCSRDALAPFAKNSSV